MLHILTHQNCRELTRAAALLAAAAALLMWPEQSMQAARESLSLCANIIIPSLFPFFVLSGLIVELGMAHRVGRLLEGAMIPLFRVSGAGASALILGLVGGYPVGARTAISLYQSGQCSKSETERLLAFCNNSGPAFILGVVGTGIFGSSRVGLLLYLVHIAASVCVGLVFRFYGGGRGRSRSTAPAIFHTTGFSAAFTASVKSALLSVLNICAFVVLFGVVIRLLSVCGLMDLGARLLACLPGLDTVRARLLLTGLVEMSSGVAALSGPDGIPLAAFILGWAGLSVHCQVLSFLGDSGLQVKTYLAGKMLHGALSALFTLALTRCFSLSVPVSGCLSQQVEQLAALDGCRTAVLSITGAWLLWLLFLLPCLSALKKRTGNSRPHAL